MYGVFLHECRQSQRIMIFWNHTFAFRAATFLASTAQPIRLDLIVHVRLALTANVLSAEYTDVCLRSKFKNKHWLFLHIFVCNGQQLDSCCFYFASNTFYQIYKKNFVLLENLFHTDKIFSVFLLDLRFDFDLNRHLSVITAAFKIIQK